MTQNIDPAFKARMAWMHFGQAKGMATDPCVRKLSEAFEELAKSIEVMAEHQHILEVAIARVLAER